MYMHIYIYIYKQLTPLPEIHLLSFLEPGSPAASQPTNQQTSQSASQAADSPPSVHLALGNLYMRSVAAEMAAVASVTSAKAMEAGIAGTATATVSAIAC